MGTTIEIKTSDGHRFSAYRAEPSSGPFSEEPRGGVLIIQEIFGVNAHIRSICDDYANEGYVAIAPALFDRATRNFEAGYDAESSKNAIAVLQRLRPGDTLRDLQATVDTLRAVGKVGVVGFCYGGTLAWIAAAKLNGVACAIGYYGGGLTQQLALEPRVPVMLHFGERDHLISASDVEKIRAALPTVPVHVYQAGHGFNCDARESYDAASAALAKQRTLEMLHAEVG